MEGGLLHQLSDGGWISGAQYGGWCRCQQLPTLPRKTRKNRKEKKTATT